MQGQAAEAVKGRASEEEYKLDKGQQSKGKRSKEGRQGQGKEMRLAKHSKRLADGAKAQGKAGKASANAYGRVTTAGARLRWLCRNASGYRHHQRRRVLGRALGLVGLEYSLSSPHTNTANNNNDERNGTAAAQRRAAAQGAAAGQGRKASCMHGAYVVVSLRVSKGGRQGAKGKELQRIAAQRQQIRAHAKRKGANVNGNQQMQSWLAAAVWMSGLAQR